MLACNLLFHSMASKEDAEDAHLRELLKQGQAYAKDLNPEPVIMMMKQKLCEQYTSTLTWSLFQLITYIFL